MSNIQRLQHTSVPIAPNGAEEARRFYGHVLGLTEIVPPRELRAGSLVWFRVGTDGQELHCFVDERARPADSGQHLCLQVGDLAACRERLGTHGVQVEEAEAIRNRPRCFVRDPFGNLIELTQIDGPYDPHPDRAG
jgi:catechol 2,3-dioxygenase-like lactoylglutathione lyase family enzyme